MTQTPQGGRPGPMATPWTRARTGYIVFLDVPSINT